MESLYKNKRVLITGGSGSLGKALISRILEETEGEVSLTIYSRDEAKQAVIRSSYPTANINYIIGNVRDREYISYCCRGMDIIIHAAALKRVDDGELNVSEFMKTNVLGSDNVIYAARICNVPQVLLVSTDKSCLPINAYGASKMLAEKLFVDADSKTIKGADSIFTIVRYGNIIASRGSVIPMFVDWAEANKPIKLTHSDMTRFFMTLDDACTLIETALTHAKGGEITVAKMASVHMVEMAKAIITKLESKSTIEVIGIRPGEKIHESLISDSAFVSIYDTGEYYIVGSHTNPKEYDYPLADIKHYTSCNFIEHDPNWIIKKIQEGGIDLCK